MKSIFRRSLFSNLEHMNQDSQRFVNLAIVKIKTLQESSVSKQN